MTVVMLTVYLSIGGKFLHMIPTSFSIDRILIWTYNFSGWKGCTIVEVSNCQHRGI